jgi:hypothetical protein
MIDRLGNPVWNKDHAAYVMRDGKLHIGTVELLKDDRWGNMYCRVTDLKDGSQCLRIGPEIVVCREPLHKVPGPWVGAEVD